MPKQQEEQIFTFSLTIVSVKMKVKFPCKMAIEQAGRPLTTEVPPSADNKFIFDQELKLRQQSQRMFLELNICLVTQKGARYISGIAKIYHNQLLRSEGSRLVITLSKCLDTEAFCELRVDRIVREAGARKRTVTTLPEKGQRIMSPRHNEEPNRIGADYRSPRKGQPFQMPFDTRSQSHFPVTATVKPTKLQDELRGRDPSGMTGFPKSYRRGNLSPKNKVRQMRSKGKYLPIQFSHTDFQREKAMEAEVYKDNYQKLKQKYLKEAETSKNEMSKRMILENNENNYKLEIVKLKMKNDQLQKTINDKNNRLKQLSITLASLQGKQAEINLLKEDLMNKEHAIHIMDDTIVSLSKQNDQLRNNTKDISYHLEEKIILLENELDMVISKTESKKQELERDLKSLTDLLEHKEQQLAKKNNMWEKEKKTVNQLQRTLQTKMFQFDTHLQNQKATFKEKLQASKHKINDLTQQLTKTNSEKNDLLSQIDKYKALLLKNEYQFKLFQQEMNSLRTEVEQLRPFKDKNNDILKELRIISEQKILIEKSHQKFVSSKQKGLEQLTNQYKRQTEYLKKNIKELETKSKNLSTKLMETETHLQFTKTSLQKLKKTNDSLTTQLNESREKQKTLRKSLKKTEEQCDDLRKQLTRSKQKTQILLQSTKHELSKNKEDLSKMRIDLQSQIVKNEQLLETNSDLNMELARLKMTQQFADQKYQKLTQSSQDKYHQFEKIIKEHESVIELLQEKIRTQKEQEKNYYGKLQKCDYEINMVVDKNDKMIKDLKMFEQRNRHLEAGLKGKQMQLVEAMKKINETESKVYLAEEKAKQLKDQLQLSTNQLDKTKRILDMIQQDHEKTKQDMLTYCHKLNDAEKDLDEKIQQLKRNKQNINDLETRFSSTKKQYEKFKQSVSEALNSSFAQMAQNISLEKLQNVKTSLFNSSEMQSHHIKRGLADLSHDLVGAINSAGKQSKTQLTKLTDKIRSLERDLDLVRNQMQRSQQTSRRQLMQKSQMIAHLQQNLRVLKDEKGQTQAQSQVLLEKMHFELKHSQNECQQLQSTKNQLQFALKGLKMEIERLSEEYETRLYQLMKENRQFQDKLEYQNNKTEHAEKTCHEYEVQMMNINSVLILEKEQSYKKDLKITELQSQKQTALQDIQSLKAKLKKLQQQYNQLQIQHLTTCQIKQKYELMLSQEENKLKDVRSFNNNILKEKEQIIRKELEKNMEISTLENNIVDLRHQMQMMEESRNKYKADLDQIKEQIKKQNSQIKDLQLDLVNQMKKYNDIREKLRQKELQLTQNNEELNLLRKKNEQQQARNKDLNEQFKEENDMLSKQLQAINAQATENIRSLESQLARTSKQLQVSKQELAQLEQALFVERENNGSMNESIHKLKLELQEVRRKLDDMEKAYEELGEQNREKDEHMFELGGKIYEYENRMRQLQEEHQRQIEEVNTNFNVKYDEDYQEMSQKVQLIEKERDYFKQKFTEKQGEVIKKIEELKHRQIQELQLKKMFEQKIKKIEEDKLILFSQKNKELTKVMQQNKSQFEALRQKDSQLRKVVHELQISRNSIQKVQQKLKEIQNDRTTQIKAYQQEIQNLRKKELTLKSYKDTVKSNQWNCEREVRKQIQGFIKKLLEAGDKNGRSQNLISSIKGMEQGMLTAIASVGRDSQ